MNTTHRGRRQEGRGKIQREMEDPKREAESRGEVGRERESRKREGRKRVSKSGVFNHHRT